MSCDVHFAGHLRWNRTTSETIRENIQNVQSGGTRGLELRTVGKAHGSKRNYWLSQVEELDWSAKPSPNPSLTSGVTLNADLEPKTHHQTPMTCTYTIWTKVLAPPSLEQKNALPNLWQHDGNIIHVFKNCISISVATVCKVSKMTEPICTSHWCLVMSFVSRSAFTVTPEVLNWD